MWWQLFKIVIWNWDDFVMEMWWVCTFFLVPHLNFPSNDCSTLWCMKKVKLKQITENLNAPNQTIWFLLSRFASVFSVDVKKLVCPPVGNKKRKFLVVQRKRAQVLSRHQPPRSPHVACVALPPHRRSHHGALLAPEAVRVVRVKCQSVGRLRHRFQFDAVIRFWKKGCGKNNLLTGADRSPFDEQA